MKNDKEIFGTLLGFDDFVNMLLEDVTEYETTPEGRRVTKLDQILLNGNNITMVRKFLGLFFTWLLFDLFYFVFSWYQVERCRKKNDNKCSFKFYQFMIFLL